MGQAQQLSLSSPGLATNVGDEMQTSRLKCLVGRGVLSWALCPRVVSPSPNAVYTTWLVTAFRTVGPLAAFGACCALCWLFLEGAFAAVVAAIALVPFGLVVCRLFFPTERRFAHRQFLCVLAANYLATSLVYAGLMAEYGMPYPGISDSSRHDEMAMEAQSCATYAEAREAIHSGHSDPSYNYTEFVALLYWGGRYLGIGSHTLVPRFVNAFFMGVLALLVARVAISVGCGPRNGELAGYLAGTWPLMLYHSAQLKRDILFTVAFVAALYFIAQLIARPRRTTLPQLAGIASGFAGVYLLRTSFVYLLCTIAVAMLTLRWLQCQTSSRREVRSLAVFLIVLA